MYQNILVPAFTHFFDYNWPRWEGQVSLKQKKNSSNKVVCKLFLSVDSGNDPRVLQWDRWGVGGPTDRNPPVPLKESAAIFVLSRCVSRGAAAAKGSFSTLYQCLSPVPFKKMFQNPPPHRQKSPHRQRLNPFAHRRNKKINKSMSNRPA